LHSNGDLNGVPPKGEVKQVRLEGLTFNESSTPSGLVLAIGLDCISPDWFIARPGCFMPLPGLASYEVTDSYHMVHASIQFWCMSKDEKKFNGLTPKTTQSIFGGVGGAVYSQLTIHRGWVSGE